MELKREVKDRRFKLIACFLLLTGSSYSQQISDPGFHYHILKPEYLKDQGPVITVDEAHFNYHTLGGSYSAFGKVLEADGYVLKKGEQKFTAEYLKQTKILVIVNAIGDTSTITLPTVSAFTNDEILALKEWVQNGGSLFLIADHMPCAGSAAKLARNFGFNVINGYAFRIDEHKEMFTRNEHNLLSNPITNGRNRSEKVDSIEIFTGTAFLAPPEATIITTLKDDYEILTPLSAGEFNDTTPGFRGNYFVNGAMLKFGKGRIVFFGEAAMFSAQLQGPDKIPMGMNHPSAAQNPQLLLNIIHWLDKKS